MTTAADTAADHLRAAGVRIDDSPTSERPGVRWILSGPSGSAHRYDVLVRTGVTTAAATLLDARPDRPLLLLADHVPDSAAEVLRARGIAFADASGNMHLRMPDVLIDVRSRRRPKPAATVREDSPAAFTPADSASCWPC